MRKIKISVSGWQSLEWVGNDRDSIKFLAELKKAKDATMQAAGIDVKLIHRANRDLCWPAIAAIAENAKYYGHQDRPLFEAACAEAEKTKAFALNISITSE